MKLCVHLRKMIITLLTLQNFNKKKKTTKNFERPKTPCLGKIPTQATTMLMTQVKYLTLPSTSKAATIYEYPSHHESYAVATPPPGHSFRPYTKKEAKKILSSSISNHSDHEVPMRCMFLDLLMATRS
jgi:hypothetical protein